MRVSVYAQDRGYKAFKALGGFGSGIEVYLDGQRLKGCVTADDKTGWVTVHEYDAGGRVILNAKRTAASRVRLRGQVEIRKAKP